MILLRGPGGAGILVLLRVPGGAGILVLLRGPGGAGILVLLRGPGGAGILILLEGPWGAGIFILLGGSGISTLLMRSEGKAMLTLLVASPSLPPTPLVAALLGACGPSSSSSSTKEGSVAVWRGLELSASMCLGVEVVSTCEGVGSCASSSVARTKSA